MSRRASRMSSKPVALSSVATAAKLVYKPLISPHPYMGAPDESVSKLHGLRRPSTIAEQDTPASTPKGTVDKVLARNRFVTPSDPELCATLKQLWQYLHDTDVRGTFENLVEVLLNRNELPYNPYAGFVRRFRLNAERFHMRLKSGAELLALTENEAEPFYMPGISTADGVWGLDYVMQTVNAFCLSQYADLLSSLSPPSHTLEEDDEYTVNVIMALVGRILYECSAYPLPQPLHMRLDYVVTGPDKQEAIETFIHCMIADISHMEQENKHIALGVTLKMTGPEGTRQQHFSTDDIATDLKDDFLTLAEETVVANKLICLDCLFNTDPDLQKYRGGQKQYAFHFVEESNETQEEQKVVSFTPNPLDVLHDGVFLSQRHIEAYMTTLCSDEPPENQHDPGNSTSHSGRNGADTHEKTGESISRTSAFGFGSTHRRDFGLAQRRDNFLDPMDSAITQPIMSILEKEISRGVLFADTTDIVHNMLRLILMDRYAYEPALFVEILQMLHSTSTALSRLQQLNNTLRGTISTLNGKSESAVATRLFVQYRQAISDVLCNPLQERSSDLVTVGMRLLGHLGKVLGDGDFSEWLPLNEESVTILCDAYDYTQVTVLQANEDALTLCPKIQKLFKKIRNKYPKEAPSKVRSFLRGERHKHGKEDAGIMKRDKTVISVSANIESDSVPRIMAMEYVLMKYITDTHLDVVWPSFMADLLTGATLPPNPVARLITLLRQCTMRMELCSETEERLLPRVTHQLARSLVDESFLYHIPGCDAIGFETSLSVVDTSTFILLSSVLKMFTNRHSPQKKGAFRIVTCCAVSGHSCLYSKLQPYLLNVELHEHYFIRGPYGCSAEARNLFTAIVFDYISRIHKAGTHLFGGLYLGVQRWSLTEILNQRKAFSSQLYEAISHKKPVYIKFYIMIENNWRFLEVRKYLKLHFINEEETEFEEFFPYDPISLYQNLFIDREQAVFHFEYGGPPHQSDPYNTANIHTVQHMIDVKITQAHNKLDWCNVHRWLLVQGLINKGTCHVMEAWQMLHSIAGQAEYLVCLTQNLHDLITYGIEAQQIPLSATRIKPAKLDKEKLKVMFLAYCQKVELLCESAAAMLPKSLLPVVLRKVIPLSTGDWLVNEETLETLSELEQFIQAIQDITSTDIQALCLRAEASIAALP